MSGSGTSAKNIDTSFVTPASSSKRTLDTDAGIDNANKKIRFDTSINSTWNTNSPINKKPKKYIECNTNTVVSNTTIVKDMQCLSQSKSIENTIVQDKESSIKLNKNSVNSDLVIIQNVDSKDWEEPIESVKSNDKYVYFSSDVIVESEDYMITSNKITPTTLSSQSSEIIPLLDSSVSTLTKQLDISPQKCTSMTTSTVKSAELMNVRQTPGNQQNTQDEVELVLISSVDEPKKPALELFTNARSVKPAPLTRIVPSANVICQNAVTTCGINTISSQNTILQSTPTGLVRSDVQTSLKNQPIVVTPKKLISEVMQTTAKVSIGNTTISVPLLKPLNPKQLQSSNLISETQKPIGSSNIQSHTCQQPQSQNPLKILNMKCGPKTNQPTIVSLSQLQIKPAKIVQAKVLGKKMQMPLQLQQLSNTSVTSQAKTSSNIVTICGTKQSKQNIAHNFNPKVAQLAIVSDSLLLKKMDEDTIDSTECSTGALDPSNLEGNQSATTASQTSTKTKMIDTTQTFEKKVWVCKDVAHKIPENDNSMSSVTQKKDFQPANNTSTLMTSLLRYPVESQCLKLQHSSNNISSAISIIKQPVPQLVTTNATINNTSTSVSESNLKTSVNLNSTVGKINTSLFSRNISLRLTKNPINIGVQQSKAIPSSTVNSSNITTYTNASTTEYLSKKMNFSMHNSLNITEVHIPNKNTTAAILSDASSIKINTGSIELQANESRSMQEHPEFSNKTTSKNIALHYAAISNNQKQKRSKSTDDNKNKEDLSIIKMQDVDISETKSDVSNDNEFNKRSSNVTELKNNMALSNPLQSGGNKENQSTSKLEETPNVLLKQLLQNTSTPHSLNQVSTPTPATTIQTSSAGDSASSSLCNPLISSRKVINVRAPCLGTVSSLEAQLARPVIPPVPATTSTTTHIQVESSDIVNKMDNQSIKMKEMNMIADQNDIKIKSSTTQIISKETSFVSNPTANVPTSDAQRYNEIHTQDSLMSMDSSSLIKTSQTVNNSTNPNQLCSFSKSSTFENNTNKFADGHIYLNISTNEKHASDAPFSGIKTVNAITTKILNSKHVDEPTKSNSIPLIEDSMKAKITQNLMPLSASTCTQNMINIEDKSSNKDSSFLLTMDSMKNKTNTLESNEGVIHNKSENASGMKQLDSVEGSKGVPAFEKNSHNEQVKTINSEKSCQVSKDVEFRKKRKREYQKQRRQLLITNKDSQNVNSNLVTSNSVNFKRRPRKFLKLEEDHDSFIENLLSRIRQMQPLQVQEPLLNRNYGVCPGYEKIIQSRMNSNKEGENHSQNQLSGEYGFANQLSVLNLYKNKDFNKLKDRSKNSLCTIQNDFYDQEFLPIIFKNDYDKQLRFIGLVQDRNMEVIDTVSKACVNTNSNENDCTSARISYPGLLLHNNENSQWMHGRMSPVIPTVSPIAQDLSVCINSCSMLNEAPKHSKKGRHFTIRENGTMNQMVILSLSHSSTENIFGVLKDLANLLNISVPTTYKIIDSPKPNAIRQYQMRIEKKDNFRIRQFRNMQSLLNGNKKICRNCGQTIIGKGVRKITNKFPNFNSPLNLIKLSRKDLHFCNLSCYENIKIKYKKQHVPSGNDLQSQNNKTALNATADSLTVDNEEQTKRSRFKYFNNKCFKTISQLKRLSEKDLVDILFKAELTVTASNTNKCVDNVQNSTDDVRQCILCNQRGDGLSDGPSRLLNFEVDKWVHLNCALWSNGVYETISGGLMNLQTALQAGFNQICSSCQTLGATIKCFKNRCGIVLHLPCAIKKQCVFYKNKTVHCQQHAPKTEKDNELVSLTVNRRVFIERDENRQVATIMHHSELTNLLRVGSLTFLNVGQLLPHQLQAFHTNNYIYPIGYKIIRFYWSMKRLNKRCRYICSIEEVSGRPEFCIQVKDNAENEVEFRDSSPRAVWQKVIEPLAITRKDCKLVQLFPQFITGEDLFGLTEPAIVRIIESLPGIETLTDYRFKYGRNPFLELPLAINPSGSARTEPKQRQLISWRKPHTQRTANVFNQRVANTSAVVAGEVACPYSKQFVHSKSSQYKKMKQEWRNNVYLARSKIQGLGLYAARDIEKHTMIIEYIGEVIRTEVSEIREKQYESKNRGIYMFRLDEDRVVDATLSGGLARYINHSCNPNCVTEIVEVDREVRIIIFAKRRINRAEELSYDYKFDIEDEANKIPCMCAAANCRKWMN